MTPDREHIISAKMLGAENTYGDASERFAVGEEAKAARLWATTAPRASGTSSPSDYTPSTISQGRAEGQGYLVRVFSRSTSPAFQ